MPWWQFAVLGAAGGMIVETVAIFRWAATWQGARRGVNGKLRRKPPPLGEYVDIPAHAIMLPSRAALGAVAAVLFGLTGQVTGPYGALAFGCAAPVLLSRLGSIPEIRKAVDNPKRNQETAHDEDERALAMLPDVPAEGQALR